MNFPHFTVGPMSMRQLAAIFLPEIENTTYRTRRFVSLLMLDDELVAHLQKANTSLCQKQELSLRAVWIIVRRLWFTKMRFLKR